MSRFALAFIPLLTGCPHFARTPPAAFTCGAPAATPARIHDPARMLAVSPKSTPPTSWTTPAPADADPWGTTQVTNPWVTQAEPTPAPPPGALYDNLAASMILDVVADRAPLGSVAIAVARATHLDVVVQPSLEDLPITLSMRGTSLAQLQQVLAQTYGVHAAMTDGVLYLASFDDMLRRQLVLPPPPLGGTLIDVPDEVGAQQFAATWCERAATPRGHASVLGDDVLIEDTQEGIARAQALRDQLGTDD